MARVYEPDDYTTTRLALLWRRLIRHHLASSFIIQILLGGTASKLKKDKLTDGIMCEEHMQKKST